MNEYRGALQALVDELNQQQDEWTRSRWPAFAAAVALLARPEPRTQRLYVFLQQRPCDKQAWPLVYVDQALAEAAPHRVTAVVAVDMPIAADQGMEAQR